MHLVIANKLYSSWSLRPWLLMRARGIDFKETVIPLRRPETKEAIGKFSPSGKVPVLIDGDVTIWDSMAIISYLDWRFPDKDIFPKHGANRARELSICNEMHGGFLALRRACPMNLGKLFQPKTWDDDVLGDVARIEQVWRDVRLQVGGDGPFLAGQFGASDAMFAPVVCRLDSYQFGVSDDTRAYMDAVLAHPAFLSWRSDALEERWVIPEYEDGHVAEESFHHPSDPLVS